MKETFLLMWLADAIDGVIFAAVLAAFASLVAMLLLLALSAEDEVADFTKKHFRRITSLVAASFLLIVLLPSKSTIQLAAAATSTSAAASTEAGKKGIEAFNAVLDKIIKKAKE
jgi:hypothetical protein